MRAKPRLFGFSDIEQRVNWINNPLINQSMYFELPATVDKTKKWLEAIEKDNSRIDFTFVDDAVGIVAMGGITNVSNNNKNAEFYVMINPDCHAKGYGKEISVWIFNYAFSILNLEKLYLYTNDNNIPAYKIYEKSGFKLEGLLRQHKIKNGVFLDVRFYGLLKSEWEKLDWSCFINEKFGK